MRTAIPIAVALLYLFTVAVGWYWYPNRAGFTASERQDLSRITSGHDNTSFGSEVLFGNAASGSGALFRLMFGSRVSASGRCAGASLIRGDNVILDGDYTAAPGREARNFTNWHNEICTQDGKSVACPPPEPECLPEGK